MVDNPHPPQPQRRHNAAKKLERTHRRQIPFVQQMATADCGAACLAMILGYHGKDVPLNEVRRNVGATRDGTNALAILQGAHWYGMRGRGVKLKMSALNKLPKASVLFWEFCHFVVFEKLTKKGVKVIDPAVGPREIPIEQFRKSFTGVALLMEPSERFEEETQNKNRTVWLYLKKALQHSGLISRLVLVALLIRVFALALPILMGTVVDRVIPRGDYNLLSVLAIGLTAIVVFNLIASLIRVHLNLHLRTQIETEMTFDFVDHLVDLPYEYFQQHATGDLMVRLNSNARIRDIVTSSALSTILDGVLIILYLLLILFINFKLGLLALFLGCLTVSLLFAIQRRQKILASQSFETHSRSQNFQVEMLAGMETLKSSGAEPRAAEKWSNLYIDNLNVSLAQARLIGWFRALSESLRMLSPLAILAYGSTLVMTNELTLGSMLALSALTAGFLGPLGTFVETLTDFQKLGSYLDRIEDVFQTPREKTATSSHLAENLKGQLHVEKVSFRYGPLTPWVVQDASFRIGLGQFVAIVGRSGSGKSTLGKLLVGLYSPEKGRILVDEIPLETYECRSFRRRLGVVTQSPYLFSSSIRSNIAISDPSLPIETIIKAAKIACIHDDILEMPMAYETLLTTGGLSLSGGQRQRIALARALVESPRILLLDEATSSLDTVTESQVLQNLRELECTRIVIAHRLSTIKDADLILVMEDGKIVERGVHIDLIQGDGAYKKLIEAQMAEMGKSYSSE
ncbi:MAG: peptidase domain-containing ABC transporter [Pseudomonadota bacterium]